jgi:hypothetical protein
MKFVMIRGNGEVREVDKDYSKTSKIVPCDFGCGYVFQYDEKRYDLLVEGQLKFVCAKCYVARVGVLRGSAKF